MQRLRTTLLLWLMVSQSLVFAGPPVCAGMRASAGDVADSAMVHAAHSGMKHEMAGHAEHHSQHSAGSGVVAAVSDCCDGMSRAGCAAGVCGLIAPPAILRSAVEPPLRVSTLGNAIPEPNAVLYGMPRFAIFRPPIV